MFLPRGLAPLAVLLLQLGACGNGASEEPRFGLIARPSNVTCQPPGTPTAPAPLLSQTGCVDPDDPRLPAAGLIPYAVSSSLWSDGAEKERFLALPEGQTITFKDCAQVPAACAETAAGGTPEDDGHLDLPVGSVLVKTFTLAGRRIETRLLVRFSQSSWRGYSYEWRADQSDAEVLADVSGGVKKAVPGGSPGQESQIWHFPSRAQCLQCHTIASGVSLGVTLAQMNRDLTYPSGVTSNQLETWEHIGLFSRPLPRPLPVALPAQEDNSASVDARARSYLHANCANCHRPAGTFEGIDLRANTALAQTGLCNTLPEKGDLGVAGARRLVPGDPGRSLTSLRMHALMDGRMPQIGTSVVDVAGARLVDDWITALGPCP
jgi:uncharacterized repeat protein (TIGR03806 family)